jgi:exonuclease VII small subunit
MREDDCITCAIAAAADRIIAYRLVRLLEQGDLNLDRVTEKLLKARGVAARANASLEAEADRLIAREDAFEKRKVEAFAPHHALLDARHREMDQVEDALKIVGNADPLDGSGDAGEVVEKPKPPPAAEHPKTPAIAPTVTSVTVGSGAGMTFREQAEAQIAAAQGAKT